MKFYNRRVITSEKGFSLIELMIVVAIIGILAAIAIPNYQRFIRKSKRSDATAQLTSYFTSTMATHAEFGVHYGNFVAVGYQPSGQLVYNISTTDSAVDPSGPNAPPNDDACITTGTGATPVVGAAAATACVAVGTVYAVSWTPLASALAPHALVSGGCRAAAAATRLVFTVNATANLGATNDDSLQITESKVINTCLDGVN